MSLPKLRCNGCGAVTEMVHDADSVEASADLNSDEPGIIHPGLIAIFSLTHRSQWQFEYRVLYLPPPITIFIIPEVSATESVAPTPGALIRGTAYPRLGR
jgi:hypothetical protein